MKEILLNLKQARVHVKLFLSSPPRIKIRRKKVTLNDGMVLSMIRFSGEITKQFVSHKNHQDKKLFITVEILHQAMTPSGQLLDQGPQLGQRTDQLAFASLIFVKFDGWI